MSLASTNILTLQLNQSLGAASALNAHLPIKINGNANLAGTLNIDLLDNFTPAPGDTIDIIHYTSRTGTFNDITTTNAPLGLYFDLLFDDINGIASLQAQAHLPGDANLDGTVNIQDLAILASNFNNTGDWFGGDFNNDGIVNIQDLGVLASTFNQSVTPNAISSNLLSSNSIGSGVSGVGGASTIPTPSSLSLLALSSLTLLKRRRHSKY